MSYYTQNAKLSPEMLVNLRLMGQAPITSNEYFNTYGRELRLQESKIQTTLHAVWAT